MNVCDLTSIIDQAPAWFQAFDNNLNDRISQLINDQVGTVVENIGSEVNDLKYLVKEANDNIADLRVQSTRSRCECDELKKRNNMLDGCMRAMENYSRRDNLIFDNMRATNNPSDEIYSLLQNTMQINT